MKYLVEIEFSLTNGRISTISYTTDDRVTPEDLASNIISKQFYVASNGVDKANTINTNQICTMSIKITKNEEN